MVAFTMGRPVVSNTVPLRCAKLTVACPNACGVRSPAIITTVDRTSLERNVMASPFLIQDFPAHTTLQARRAGVICREHRLKPENCPIHVWSESHTLKVLQEKVGA